MKREEILKMACTIVARLIQNPINYPLAERRNTYERTQAIRNEVQCLVGLANEMNILIED